jgi:magnesium transporter
MADQRVSRDQRGLTRALSRVSRILSTPQSGTGTRPSPGHGAIVNCGVYQDGARLSGSWDYAEALRVARQRPDAFVWLGLHEPDADEFARIAGTFDLHELPVEDAIKSYQRPKLERYGQMTFAALRTARYVEHDELTETSEVVQTGYVMLFVGRDFVITVRHGSAGDLAPVRADMEAKPDLLAHGPWAVVHAIFDRVVDSYLDCAAAVEQDIDLLEESVFSRQGAGNIQRIYQLKRELVEFKRTVMPLQRPLAALTSGQPPEIPGEVRRYFRDVHDHLTRTVEQVQSFDDLLNSILQARLAQVTVEQNDDMRKIAAWAGIAAVWTSVAGIYGMNFRFMPELNWVYGYPIVLALCVCISIALYRFFRRSGWL